MPNWEGTELAVELKILVNANYETQGVAGFARSTVREARRNQSNRNCRSLVAIRNLNCSTFTGASSSPPDLARSYQRNASVSSRRTPLPCSYIDAIRNCAPQWPA
jgi:hypothetical protein